MKKCPHCNKFNSDEAYFCRYCSNPLIGNIDEMVNQSTQTYQNDYFTEGMLNDIYRKFCQEYSEIPIYVNELISQFISPVLTKILFPILFNADKAGKLSSNDKEEIENFLNYKASQMGFLCFFTGYEMINEIVSEKYFPHLTIVFAYYYIQYAQQVEKRLLPESFIKSPAGIDLLEGTNKSIQTSAFKIAINGTLYRENKTSSSIGHQITPFQSALIDLQEVIKNSI